MLCRPKGSWPLRGQGKHVTVHNGVMFLLTSEENKRELESKAVKHQPACGGCRGLDVSIGKKFYGDPDSREIVDERL